MMPRYLRGFHKFSELKEDICLKAVGFLFWGH